MSLTIYEDVIYLSPRNLGIVIKNIDNNTIYKNTIWTKGNLHAYDLDKKNIYEVMIHRISNTSVLVKPVKPYYCYVFEDMFDFGYDCDEFSENKIINIYTN